MDDEGAEQRWLASLKGTAAEDAKAEAKFLATLNETFEPCVIIDDGPDPYIEYVNEDTVVFYDRVDDTLELVRRMDDRTVVGARIYAKLSISTACGSRKS